jgi:hypothetical protein
LDKRKERLEIDSKTWWPWKRWTTGRVLKGKLDALQKFIDEAKNYYIANEAKLIKSRITEPAENTSQELENENKVPLDLDNFVGEQTKIYRKFYFEENQNPLFLFSANQNSDAKIKKMQKLKPEDAEKLKRKEAAEAVIKARIQKSSRPG